MTRTMQKVLGGVVAGVVIVVALTTLVSRGCDSDGKVKVKDKVKVKVKDKAEAKAKESTESASEGDSSELEELKQTVANLQERVANLQERLAEAKAEKEATPQANYQITADEESPAVKAKRRAWEATSRDLKMATTKKISAAQEAEEKRLQLQDRTDDLREEVASITQTIASLKRSVNETAFNDADTKLWRRAQVREWEGRLAKTKRALLEVEAQSELP